MAVSILVGVAEPRAFEMSVEFGETTLAVFVRQGLAVGREAFELQTKLVRSSRSPASQSR
jgi:hypothetical protein